MGMFDEIKGDFWCPFCGKKMIVNGTIRTFQTKDLKNNLCVFSLEEALIEYYINFKKGDVEKFHIYSDCPYCKKWISLEITHLVNYDMKEKIKKYIESSKDKKEELSIGLYNSLFVENKSEAKNEPKSFEEFLNNYKMLRNDFEKKTKDKPKTQNGKFGEGLWNFKKLNIQQKAKLI